MINAIWTYLLSSGLLFSSLSVVSSHQARAVYIYSAHSKVWILIWKYQGFRSPANMFSHGINESSLFGVVCSHLCTIKCRAEKEEAWALPMKNSRVKHTFSVTPCSSVSILVNVIACKILLSRKAQVPGSSLALVNAAEFWHVHYALNFELSLRKKWLSLWGHPGTLNLTWIL